MTTLQLLLYRLPAGSHDDAALCVLGDRAGNIWAIHGVDDGVAYVTMIDRHGAAVACMHGIDGLPDLRLLDIDVPCPVEFLT